MDSVEAELFAVEKRGLLRHLSQPRGADFASNDYLGYSENSEIRAQLLEFLSTSTKIGSTGSRLISGNSQHTEETESFLAKCFNVESTLIFGSGYLANMGVCVAIGGADTEFFSDELNHASIIDGIKLSRSKVSIFAHNDMNQLSELLLKSPSRRKVIITESIFSMDGDLAPIQELIEIADKFGAYLVIDEAHSTGTCGVKNLGKMTEFAFDPLKTIVVHTCGKALGAYGAFVCGTSEIKRLLLNKARSQIFTTALPPSAVEHIRLSVSHLVSDSKSVAQLHNNIVYSQDILKKYGFRHSGTHIVPIILGSNEAVLNGAGQLSGVGIFVKAIRSPTVAPGSERVRLTIKSNQDMGRLEQICHTLAELRP